MSVQATASQPLVSIIMPVFQAARYLPASLDSVMAQTYTNVEVLMIDDDSTDGSSEICRAYASRDPRFVYMHHANEGVSAARNAGVAAARGTWIAALDSDDVLLPDAIQTLVEAALQNDVALVMAGYYECHNVKPIPFRRSIRPRAGVWRGTAEVQRVFITRYSGMCHMWTKLIRKDLFEQASFPVGRIYEDISIMPHLLEAADSLAVVRKPIYRYQVRPGSITTKVNILRQMDGLTARMAWTDFLAERYPDLVPLGHDATLTICCDLMARMEHVGIENVPEQWDKVIATVREIMPLAAKNGILFRIMLAAFRRNPRIVSKVVHFALRLDRMI